VFLLVTLTAAGSVARYQPIAWKNEVSGKNFPLFALIDADQAARTAITSSPDLRALLDARRKAMTEATDRAARPRYAA
jgi:hypothetical protein